MSDPAGRGVETSSVRWLSERVRCVLAPNPSPMTLEGTNTYLVGRPGAVIVMDPGPDDDAHLAAVAAAAAGANVIAVLLTHRHPDHAEGARRCAEMLDTVIASGDEPSRPDDVPLRDGLRFGGDGVFLDAIATPGHSSDHYSFVLAEERILFTGDHILGRGTTVVAHPDGDMGEYLASLERLRGVDVERIFPGHGPMIEEPQRVITEYIDHRLMRERQVIEGLASGPATPEELVARIYADVDPILHPVAALSVRAHLAKLAREGRAVQDGEQWRPS